MDTSEQTSPDFIALENGDAAGNKTKKKFVHPKKTPEERKKEKEQRRLRKARVILRNLPFKATEKQLVDEFSKYGTIKECNLMKREDGKLIGCAFIQYEKVNQAAKAIHHRNNKEFLGRSVILDWAVNRKKFVQHLREAKKSAIKTVKEEKNEDDEIKQEDESSENDAHEEDQSGEDSENDDEDAEDGESADEKEEMKPIHTKSNDVAEGCTVFIKNIPFESTSDDLRKVCRPFGPIAYAVITNDKISGHSKGTGFVKFRTKESADMCLNAGTEFKLMDQVLDPHPALSRNEVNQMSETKKKQPRDTRNLFLAKEGVILSGTPAAEGVSASDLAKRLRLEQSKNQSLKNLNRFVSMERLSIHNIPPSYDSAKLRKVVVKTSGMKPKECRVMRENRPSLGHPLGKSKGYGFLSFKTHEEALNCLRKLNNNPHAFGKNNRPIVSFSIEDKAVHNIKMKRLQKSRERNPLFKKNLKEQTDTKLSAKSLKKLSKKAAKTKVVDEENLAEFAGTTAKKGSQFKTRPMWKLREEATSHSQSVSKTKKEQRKKKEQLAIRQEKRQIERPKMGKRKVEADSSLVNKYIKMLHSQESSQPKAKRSKWYTD